MTVSLYKTIASLNEVIAMQNEILSMKDQTIANKNATISALESKAVLVEKLQDNIQVVMDINAELQARIEALQAVEVAN
jgi:hypothetical protein